MSHSPDITRVLNEIERGDSEASARLFAVVYDDLHAQATKQMSNERVDHTLQPTALIHDAYLRIVGADNEQEWNSRAHFYAAAARAMQRVLIEHARSKSRLKRGGDRVQLTWFDVGDQGQSLSHEHLLELDDALQKLEQSDQPVAELVRLRLYAGLSVADAAGVLRMSRTMAYDLWNYALAWFSVELGPSESSSSTM